jgi:hypothetical protein
MHKHIRASGAVWIAWAALLTLLTGSSVSFAAERLIVRTYNNVGVTAEQMSHARDVAGVILQGADLHAVWRDCTADCAEALGPRELIVRIVAAPQGIVAESLGCALIDLQHRAGTLATVYPDRINAVAFRTGVDAGTLLGRAVAHEIGHLLLGTTHHSAGGLMRALWSDQELQRGLPADWTFAPDDVARIGRGLAARDCGACSVIAHRTPFWAD